MSSVKINRLALLNKAMNMAHTMGVKFHLSPKEYKTFCKAMGHGWKDEYVETDYRKACETRCLCLDYNSIYGGYVIQQLMPSTGVHTPLGSTRHSASVYADIIQAYCLGASDAKKLAA